MANTRIHITGGGGGGFYASPDSAPFKAGDSVTFISAGGAQEALLCFSGKASDSMTPSPHGPVTLAAGAIVTFVVSGPSESGCCVLVASTGHQGSPDGTGLPAGVLQVMETGQVARAPGDPLQR